MWTCCGERGGSTGCKSSKHSAAPSSESSDTLTAQSSGIPSLLTPISSRPLNGTRKIDEAAGTYPGQDFVRQICEAEKEKEKADRLKEQQKSSKSPPRNSSGNGSVPMDTDFRSLPDYSPPLRTLPEGDPEKIFSVDTPFPQPIDLSSDPDRSYLHAAEICLAQKLRLTCASYLCTKRRIFKGLIENLQEGKEYKKSYAQTACKVDARKTRSLFTAFEGVGWFDPKYFAKYTPNAKLGTGEMSDSDISVESRANAGATPDASSKRTRADAAAYQPAAAAHTTHQYPTPTTNGTRATPPLLNGDRRPLSSASDNSLSKRKQPHPTQHLHPSTSFTPVNDLPTLPPISPHPPTPLAVPVLPSLSSSYPRPSSAADGPNMNHHAAYRYSAPTTPTREILAADSPETYQWRKTGSGKKMQVPICPYPRNWNEADTVDRELVRLKRHEGKQWEELFEWWRAQGRRSLKNASCLAVRYSILKKHYEELWVAEGL